MIEPNDTKKTAIIGKEAILLVTFKVAENPVTFKVNKPGIQADRLLCLVKILVHRQFWESSTVHCP